MYLRMPLDSNGLSPIVVRKEQSKVAETCLQQPHIVLDGLEANQQLLGNPVATPLLHHICTIRLVRLSYQGTWTFPNLGQIWEKRISHKMCARLNSA